MAAGAPGQAASTILIWLASAPVSLMTMSRTTAASSAAKPASGGWMMTLTASSLTKTTASA